MKETVEECLKQSIKNVLNDFFKESIEDFQNAIPWVFFKVIHGAISEGIQGRFYKEVLINFGENSKGSYAFSEGIH